MDIFYVCDFIWGLCVIVSWAGWGSLLRQVLGISDRRSADWGMRAGWGAATTIAIGGVLNLCRISTQPVLIALVLIGLLKEVTGLITRFRHWLPRYRLWKSSPKFLDRRTAKARRRLIPAILFIGPCVLALGFLYTGSVHQPFGLNPYDDFLAYLVFPLRMLQTGTLIEPFSQRRLVTFGGHSFLMATLFSGSSADMAFTLEEGMCPIVVAGLIYGFLRPRTARKFFFAGLLIYISFITRVPRVNTMSSATGVMLFLTLFRTFALENRAPSQQRKRIGWATVIVVAAIGSLRVNFLIAGFVALMLSRIFVKIDRSVVDRLKDAAIDSAKACIFLMPWSLLLFISSRTFFYPLMKGNERNFYMFARTNFALLPLLGWIGDYWSSRAVLLLLAPVLLLAFSPLRKCRGSRAALIFAAGALVASFITLAGAPPAINNLTDIYRWTFPMLFSMSLAALSIMTTAPIVTNRLISSVLAALGLVLLAARAGAVTYLWQINVASMTSAAPSQLLFLLHQADSHDLQDAIPQGASFLAILNYPNLLDYRRNEIYNADMLLPYGPYPGTPFFQGPDALKRYLESLNIHYVAAVDFDEDHTSWYSRPNDLNRVIHSNPAFYMMKSYFFDYMSNIDTLEHRGQVLFHQNGLRVFRLDG